MKSKLLKDVSVENIYGDDNIEIKGLKTDSHKLIDHAIEVEEIIDKKSN